MVTDTWLDLPRVGRNAYIAARKNAPKRGIAFDLSKPDMVTLWKACETKCAISGIPLDTVPGPASSEYGRNPWRPSVDRVDSKRGYDLGNCRIVCVVANIAMNEWGEDVLRKLARAVVRGHSRKSIREYVELSIFKAATGYTDRDVSNAVDKGYWREGQEFSKDSEGRLTICLAEFDAWVSGARRAP